jgi:hypothetical protein
METQQLSLLIQSLSYTHRGGEVFPIHGVLDEVKRTTIAESMEENGWVGVPLLVWGRQLLTGSHRYAAAKDAGIALQLVDYADLFSFDDETEAALEDCEGGELIEYLIGYALRSDRTLCEYLGVDC